MGKKFGELGVHMRGCIQYSLSPHEQNPFRGFFNKGGPNLVRRFLDQVWRITPPFIVGYLVYDWGEKENARWSRKNPKDFENDE